MSADEEAIEPTRLLDDPSELSELRDAIVREQELRVDYDEAKGLERFRAAIGAGASAPELPATSEPRPTGAVRSWTSTAPRLVVGVAALIAGASVGVAWLGARDATSPAASPGAEIQTILDTSEPAKPAPVPTLAVESLPTAESLSAAEPAPAPAASSRPPVARSPRTADAPAATPAESAPTASAPDPLEETRHLGALRRVAASDPHRALSMVDEGNRRFAGGSFREEREAIAIDVLARLGREDEAKRAAAAFLATYPTSPFASKVRRATGL